MAAAETAKTEVIVFAAASLTESLTEIKALYEAENPDIELVFKLAALGIVVSVLNILLSRSGREEQALMTTIAGLIVVLVLIVREIAELFSTIKTLFGF